MHEVLSQPNLGHVSTPKNLRRKYGVDDSKISDNDFKTLFKKLDSNQITKDSVENILIKFAKDEKIDFNTYKPLDDSELEKEIKKILKECTELEFRLVIPRVMSSLSGRAEGKKIMEMLKKLKKPS